MSINIGIESNDTEMRNIINADLGRLISARNELSKTITLLAKMKEKYKLHDAGKVLILENIRLFIESRLKTDNQSYVTHAQMYDEYCKYCTETNTIPASSVSLSYALQEYNYPRFRIKGCRAWKYVQLLNSPAPSPQTPLCFAHCPGKQLTNDEMCSIYLKHNPETTDTHAYVSRRLKKAGFVQRVSNSVRIWLDIQEVPVTPTTQPTTI